MFIRIYFLLALDTSSIVERSSILILDVQDHAIAFEVFWLFSLAIYELTITHEISVHLFEKDEGQTFCIDPTFTEDSELLNLLGFATTIVPFVDLMIPWLIFWIDFY